MKNINKLLISASLALAGLGLTNCNLDVIPSDALTGSQITSTSDGLTSLLNGCYSLMKDIPDQSVGNNWYLRQYYQLSDFASDDIVCAYKTEDELINSFRYKNRSSEKTNINSFWAVSYKIIYGANTAIAIADQKEADEETNQLKGEAYFMRSFAAHNLLRLFAKPYSEANKNTPGIILRENSLDSKKKGRATLEESYQYIISGLKMAASLMPDVTPESRNSNCFASKAAAWAMLSRVYLYHQEWSKCIDYADSVISLGIYSLETPETYPDYFANAKSSAETIWLVSFLPSDDKKEGSIASMIFNGPSCWGEEGATPSLMDEMGFGTDMMQVDQRWKYIETDNPGFKNGITLYYIKKFSGQDNSATLSSPVMLRLAEVYLNMAEAYAHEEDVTNALAAVNELRTNRMLVPDGGNLDDYLLDATRDNITNTNVVDAVLKERRIELAFEGQRIFDLIRNGKDIVRNYWGFHLDTYNGIPSGSVPGLATAGVVFHASDPVVIYPIPSQELSTNNLCVPNE